MSYIKQFPRRGRKPTVPDGWERDPDDDYTIRVKLKNCVHRDYYQPTNTCCAKQRNRCLVDMKDVYYFDCLRCVK